MLIKYLITILLKIQMKSGKFLKILSNSHKVNTCTVMYSLNYESRSSEQFEIYYKYV